VDCTLGGTANVAVDGPLASGPFYFNIYNGPGQVLHRLVPMDGKVKILLIQREPFSQVTSGSNLYFYCI
jgi:hypothetical protein